MTTVCTACGTENRDKARYCRGCARPLVPLGTPGAAAETPAAGASAHQKTRRSRSRARRAARWRRTVIRAGLGAVVLMTGLLVWWLWPGDPPSESAAVAAVASTPPVEASSPATPALLATVPPPTASVTRTVTTSQKTTDPQAAPANPAPQPRPKPTPARPKPATAAAAPAPEPVRSAPVTPAPVAEAPPTPVVAPKPRGVDDSCADRGNFFSRDLCRIQACGNPALAGDPVCVRFREMEAANRSRTGS